MNRKWLRLWLALAVLPAAAACSSGKDKSADAPIRRVDAAGNVATGTTLGTKWSAFLRAKHGAVFMFFEVATSPGTTAAISGAEVDLTHAPNHQGALSLTVETGSSSSNGSPATGESYITGAVVRGKARVVRGRIGGHEFSASVVDPGASYRYDVFATVLPVSTVASSLRDWSAVAYDSSGKRVVSYVAP